MLVQHFKIHLHPVQKPQAGKTLPRAHFCRFLQHAMTPIRRKVCMMACLLPASLSTHPHGCHTSAKPPVQPQEMLQKMPSWRSKISTQSDPFIPGFQLLLTVFCSSEQSGHTAKPFWVCRRGGEPCSGRVNPSVLHVGAAKPINAGWHKQGCIFIQQQKIWNFQNERWKIILIKNTSRLKSVCKGSFSLAITLEEHNVQSLKPQYVTSDVCCHSSFVPITSSAHRDKAQLGPSPHTVTASPQNCRHIGLMGSWENRDSETRAATLLLGIRRCKPCVLLSSHSCVISVTVYDLPQ